MSKDLSDTSYMIDFVKLPMVIVCSPFVNSIRQTCLHSAVLVSLSRTLKYLQSMNLFLNNDIKFSL